MHEDDVRIRGGSAGDGLAARAHQGKENFDGVHGVPRKVEIVVRLVWSRPPGADTGGVCHFARGADHPGHIAGARVVAAYKGGSKDIEDSVSRVDKFAEEITDTSTAWKSFPTSRPCSPKWTWCCSRASTGACTWNRRGR